MCEALTEVERFYFPLLNVALQIFHLFANGFAPGFELLDGVGTERLNQLLLLRDFIV